MIRFGPHQCSYKTHVSRANIVNAVLDADTKNIIRLGHFNLIYVSRARLTHLIPRKKVNDNF